MKNFLFVVPRYVTPGNYYVFPIGMAYVVACMRQKGYRVFCLNLCHCKDPIESLLRLKIKENNIDVVCTGAMSFYWNEVQAILEAVEQIDKSIFKVVGGAMVTANPELAMKNLPIDIGIIGEGEETMTELAVALCNQKGLAEVKGLIFRTKGRELTKTPPRPLIEDLDRLPLPDYESLEYGKFLDIKWIMQPSIGGLYFDIFEKQRLSEIVTTRGCPFSCTFCYHPIGQKYRQRSLDNVFREIDFLVKRYDINILNLLDELFALDEKRIYEFTRRIKDYRLKWMAQWRVTNINADVFQALKESGIFMLGFGVESMNDQVLKSMKKNITKAQIERAFELSLQTGVHAEGNIILGDPQETQETAKESVDWWMKHPEYDINIGFLLAVPDSPVYRDAVARGLIKDEVRFIKDRFPLINLTKISDKKFDKLKNRLNYYVLTQRFLIPGKLVSSEKEGPDYEGKPVYHFQVECSLCRHISEYRYFRFSSKPYSLVLCKNCRKRLKISTKKAFPGDYNACQGYIFHHAFILYFIFLRKFRMFKILGQMAKKFSRRLGLPQYSGWLGGK